MSKVIIQRWSERRIVNWDGSANSDPVELSPGSSFAIYLPVAYNSGVNGTLTIQQQTGHVDADTWCDRASDGTALSVTVKPGAINYLPAELFSGVGTVRFVSGDGVQTIQGELFMNT